MLHNRLPVSDDLRLSIVNDRWIYMIEALMMVSAEHETRILTESDVSVVHGLDRRDEFLPRRISTCLTQALNHDYGIDEPFKADKTWLCA